MISLVTLMVLTGQCDPSCSGCQYSDMASACLSCNYFLERISDGSCGQCPSGFLLVSGGTGGNGTIRYCRKCGIEYEVCSGGQEICYYSQFGVSVGNGCQFWSLSQQGSMVFSGSGSGSASASGTSGAGAGTSGSGTGSASGSTSGASGSGSGTGGASGSGSTTTTTTTMGMQYGYYTATTELTTSTFVGSLWTVSGLSSPSQYTPCGLPPSSYTYIGPAPPFQPVTRIYSTLPFHLGLSLSFNIFAVDVPYTTRTSKFEIYIDGVLFDVKQVQMTGMSNLCQG